MRSNPKISQMTREAYHSSKKGCLITCFIFFIIILGPCIIEKYTSVLFRQFVSIRIPASVVIHESESRLMNAVVFVHFTVSEDDLDQIIKDHGFSAAPYKPPIQEPSWFATHETDMYWSACGGTEQLWFSKKDNSAYFKQVNP
jgi:hypothetical protein